MLVAHLAQRFVLRRVKNRFAQDAVQSCSPDELQQALQLARRTDGVSVVVVRTNPAKRVPGFGGWWDVPVAQVSGQARVNAARQAYDGTLQKLPRRG